MGKLKLWGGISCSLTNFRGRSDNPSVRGHRPSLTSETQSPSPYGWPGRGNYLEKNFQQFSFRPLTKKIWTVYWPSEFHRSNFKRSYGWGTVFGWPPQNLVTFWPKFKRHKIFGGCWGKFSRVFNWSLLRFITKNPHLGPSVAPKKFWGGFEFWDLPPPHC